MSFESEYSQIYDAIHSDRNFANDVMTVMAALPKNISEKFSELKVLDFGCGTGHHSNELSKFTSEIAGYDRSPWMINKARVNFPKLFFTSNLSEVVGNFDLVFSLFDVVSYQVSKAQLIEFLGALEKSLVPGGYAVLDGWHAPGVKKCPPEFRTKSLLVGFSEYIRKVAPLTVVDQNTYTLRITVEDSVSGYRLSDELHILKALDFDEFEAAATACGLEVISFSDRENISERASDASWRFIAVIRKMVSS